MDFLYYPYLSNLVGEEDKLSPSSTDSGVRFEIISNEKPPDTASKPRYKLTFFNGRGMVELSRWILVYRGIDFIDKRLEFTDWWKDVQWEKSYQLLPLLEFDGKVICQTTAIARYLARMHGLAGRDPYEQAQVDSVIDIVKEFLDRVKPSMILVVKQNKDFHSGFKNPDTMASIAQMMVPAIEKHFPLLQVAAKNSSKHGHGFIFDSGLTFADFAIANLCDIVDTFMPNLSSRYPPLNDLTKHILTLPELQKYLKNRPQTAL